MVGEPATFAKESLVLGLELTSCLLWEAATFFEESLVAGGKLDKLILCAESKGLPLVSGTASQLVVVVVIQMSNKTTPNIPKLDWNSAMGGWGGGGGVNSCINGVFCKGAVLVY